MRLMSWPDGERYSCLLQSLVVSLFLSLVSTLLFSWTGGVLSHRNSSTYKVPSIFTEELVLPRHARCVLSRLRCNGHSQLLSSYLSSIGKIENSSCSACRQSSRTLLISFCTVQLRILCAARSLATLCLPTTSNPRPGKLSGFWGSMVSRHAPIPRKGSGNNNSTMVHQIQKMTVEHLESKIPNLQHVEYFNDGRAYQYKNKKSFYNLSNHYDDFGVQASVLPT